MPLCPQITVTPVTVTDSGITMGAISPVVFPTTMALQSLIGTQYSVTAPAAYTIGQLWADASSGNKLYRCFTVATVTNAVGNGTTVTYTCDYDHGLQTGDLITITEIDPTAYNLTAVLVASTPTTDTFTVTNSATGTYVEGGWVAGWEAIQDEAIQDAADLAASKARTYRQASTPTVGMQIGDIWFDTDDGNKQYRYESTGWVSVQDGAIANAQASADGKNTIFYQASAPTAIAVDDIWFDTDDGYRHYRWNGSSWTAFQLGNNAIASLSASKLTAGTIDASVITVSNINAGNITAGTLSAIAINNGAGTFQVSAAGALTASSATITGKVTATSGAIGGITINTDRLTYGNMQIFGSGSVGTAIIDTDRGCSFKEVAASGTTDLALYSNGGLYVSGKVYVGGVTAATGLVYAVIDSSGYLRRGATVSSERYKNSIVDIADIPELDPSALLSIPVRAYKYNDDVLQGDDSRYQVFIPGFIAEEVDAAYPLAVEYNNDGQPEAVNAPYLIPGILALVQQQAATIRTLEARIAALETA